jgi:hypothetical protein
MGAEDRTVELKTLTALTLKTVVERIENRIVKKIRKFWRIISLQSSGSKNKLSRNTTRIVSD